ncbi:dolichyl-diphosphooligosaccharide--protein glycosyltransferase subunit [Holotrichia oblita]|uniref:Dolichyl-diphosphooligosaccharide--protein glycosyltransferase subunit n=1 Tax=Holotrichia oblita TaxID=644536 RepID=A0ACB9TNK4_HOLOL|nr:dolichyl-diphosphooligosaccharide--protein glycosyltransferase subunit [Holotrichia oblita]
MIQAGTKKPPISKLNSKTGISSLIIFVVLLLAWIAGFSSRLFAVIRFESIIHEFDPWFNYRATAYMVKHGFYNFLNWFDERAWYPLGRIVGGTVYPGLMITSGSIHYLLHLLHINVHIRDICVFLAPIFSCFVCSECSILCGVMVRLMLTLTPVVCMLSGIAFSGLLDLFFKEDAIQRPEESEPEESSAVSSKLYDKVEYQKMKHEQQPRETDPIGPNVRSIILVVIMLLLMLFAVHCTWVTSNAYSSPSVVLASYSADGSRQILDDFREAYFWLSQNTADHARVMSWWDYGYQIAGWQIVLPSGQ